MKYAFFCKSGKDRPLTLLCYYYNNLNHNNTSSIIERIKESELFCIEHVIYVQRQNEWQDNWDSTTVYANNFYDTSVIFSNFVITEGTFHRSS